MPSALELELTKALVGLCAAALAWFARAVIADRIMLAFTTYRNLKAGAAVMASPAFMSLPATMADVSARVARLEGSIRPNGGSSIADGINRIESSLLSLAQTQSLMVNQTGIAMWRSNAAGECVWASQALLDLVGWSFEDGFQGSNWTNIYFSEDVPTIVAKWNDAVQRKHGLSIPIRYRHRDGHEIPVHVRATCLADGSLIGTATRRGDLNG